MKRAIDNIRYGWPAVLIGLILFGATQKCKSQELSKEPYKGANAFIIRTKIQNPDSAYHIVGQRLVDTGYAIESSSKEFMQFKTALQGIGHYVALKYAINVTFKNGDLIIRPDIDMGTMLLDRQWRYYKSGWTRSKYYVVENDIKNKLGSLGEFLYTKL